MREAMVAADRQFEVRRAARAWRRCSAIDEATEAAIAALHPDDRVRTTRLFRFLFFFFTWFGASSALGLFGTFAFAAAGGRGGSVMLAGLYFVAGLVAFAAAEWMHGKLRLRRFGVEEATVWIGISHTVGGGLWLFDRMFDPSPGTLLVAGGWGTAAASLLAAWRWGTPWTGFVAAGGLLAALTQLPFAHLAWLLVATLTAWPLAHLALAEHISPEGRRRFREAFVVMSLAAYFAIHVDVVESRLFRFLDTSSWNQGATAFEASLVLVMASRLAMLLLPAIWLSAGLARKFRLAVDLGALFLLATLTTFAIHLRPQPEWLFLAASGLVLITGVLLLRRFFARRPGEEWQGITTRALIEPGTASGALETLAVLVAFAPTARATPLPPEEGIGAGGEFGGGGASAKF